MIHHKICYKFLKMQCHIDVELPLQESIINPSYKLTQKIMQDTFVNETTKSPEEPHEKLLQDMSQDVCDKPV